MSFLPLVLAQTPRKSSNISNIPIRLKSPIFFAIIQKQASSLEREDYKFPAAFFLGTLLRKIQSLHTDWIVLAGFLWLVPSEYVQAFPQRIINLHPALLPKFGGKGMYGHFVHEAVVVAGEKESGITIHYVNEHYDEGAIIFQSSFPVLPSDTPEDVAKKGQVLEHRDFPKVIESLVLPTTA